MAQAPFPYGITDKLHGIISLCDKKSSFGSNQQLVVISILIKRIVMIILAMTVQPYSAQYRR